MYIDICIAAVPETNKEKYLLHSADICDFLQENGALELADCWGNDIPEGKINSLHTAVKRKEGEAITAFWVVWPSKAVRDKAWEKMEKDPRLNSDITPLPFDGSRLIMGGFEPINQWRKK